MFTSNLYCGSVKETQLYIHAFAPYNGDVVAEQEYLSRIEHDLAESQLEPRHIPALCYLKRRVERLPIDSRSLLSFLDQALRQLSRRGSQDDLFARDLAELSLDNPAACMARIREYVASGRSCPIHTITQALFSRMTSAIDMKQFVSCQQLVLQQLTIQAQVPVQNLATVCEQAKIDIKRLAAYQVDRSQLPQLVSFFARLPTPSVDDAVSLLEQLSLDGNKTLCPEIAYRLVAGIETNDRSQLQFVFEGDSKRVTMTRLQAAVLLGRIELVQALLHNGLDPNERDNQGTTACHMASCFPDWPMMCLLYSYGGNFETKTALGASCFDLLKARGFGQKQSHIVTLFKQETVVDSDVFSRVGRHYLYDSVYTFDALFIAWGWKLSQSDYCGTCPIEKEVYSEFLLAKQHGICPPVYLQKIDDPSHPLSGQFEVRAARDIPAGSFVMEWTGHVTEIPKVDPDFRYSRKLLDKVVIDSERGGSFAELFNHGPPICTGFEALHQGVVTSLVYTTCNVKQGQALYTDYGKEYFYKKRLAVCELDPVSVESFVTKTNELSRFTNNLDTTGLYSTEYSERLDKSGYTLPEIRRLGELSNESVRQRRLDIHYTMIMIRYLYWYPEHLFRMVSENKLPKARLKTFIEYCDRFAFADPAHTQSLAPKLI